MVVSSNPRLRRRRLAWSAAVLAAIPVVAWAAMAAGLSIAFTPGFAYRVLVYGDSDVGDHARLPSRPVANAAPVFHFRGPPDPMLPQRLRGIAYHQRGHATPPTVEDFERFLQDSETTALLIVQDDRLLYEGYFNGYTRDSIQTSFSMAKSVTSLLIGAAIDEGVIGAVGDPVRKYLPELSDTLQPVTLRHLLRMTAGVESHLPRLLGLIDAPWGDDARIYYGEDLRALALGVQAGEPPATRFHYNNFDPPLLGLVLERATGRPVPEYLSQKLWQPLGMEAAASWTVDSAAKGFPKMESGINARAIDFAKLGRLMLRRGDWDGRRILSEAWVRESTRAPADGLPLSYDGWVPPSYLQAGGYYAYMWWGYDRPGGEPDFFANGKHGQVLYISPAKHAVLLRHGTGNHDLWWGEVLHAIAERL